MPVQITVTVAHDGVVFAIDHQAFELRIECDDEESALDRHRWYGQQLLVALRRLAAADTVESQLLHLEGGESIRRAFLVNEPSFAAPKAPDETETP